MAPHAESERGRQTHSGFCEKFASDCSKLKVCSYVDDEVGKEWATSVIDGGIELSRVLVCDKWNAAGRRETKIVRQEACTERSMALRAGEYQAI